MTPDPTGVWPLIDDIQPLEKKKMFMTKGSNIGFDPIQTPLGFPSSALFSGKWMPGKSYLEVENGLQTSDITIMAWIYLNPDQIGNDSSLFDFRTESDDSLLNIVLTNGTLQGIIPVENQTVIVSSPGNTFFVQILERKPH